MTHTYLIKRAGLLIGFGMGGFIDGILFHQILQVHNMLSNRIFPDNLIKMEVNMFWDGIFHVLTWVTTLIGISLLWKAVNNGTKHNANLTPYFLGAALCGWGCFNIIEGIIDHHMLKLHHVIQRTTMPIQLYWDLAFLLVGVVLLLTGIWLINKKSKSP